MLGIHYDDTRTLEDGTVVSVSANPLLLIVKTVEGVESHFSAEVFEAEWEKFKKFFNTSAPAVNNDALVEVANDAASRGVDTAPTEEVTDVDEKDKGGVAEGPAS